MNLVTSKLAAHLGTAHLELHDFLDHEAERAAAIVDAYVYKLVKIANQKPPLHPYQLEMEVRALLGKLPNAIGKRVYESLLKCGKKSTDLAAVAIVRAVPLKYLTTGFEVQEAAGGAILRAIIKPFKRKEPAAKLVDVKRSFRDYLIEPLKKGIIEKIVLGGAKAIARLMQTVKQAINPKKIADILVKGISQSKNRHQQARDLINELGIPRTAAKRLVRTEGARVATESNMQSYDKLGTAVIGYMIHATPNPDSRWWHRQRSGTVYYKEPTEGQKGLDQMPRPPMEAKDPKERPEDAPEVAHNCILPGAIVEGNFDTGIKSYYSGQAIEITCRSGSRISVTPNHPIYTSKGIIAAKNIKAGFKLLSHRGNNNAAVYAKNKNNRPTTIEKAFGSIEKSGFSAVEPSTRFNFHGDFPVRDSNVNVVTINRELLFYKVASLYKFFSQFVFPLTNVPAYRFTRNGSLHLGIDRVFLPTPSLLSGLGDFLLSLRGSLGIPSYLRIGHAANIDTSLYQFTSQPKKSITLPIDTTSCYPKFIRQLKKRHPRQIAFDDVIEVRNFNYSGHVYDLQSEQGFILANNIFLSNCLCFVSPVMRPLDEVDSFLSRLANHKVVPDNLVYSDWFSTTTEKLKRRAVGSRRFDLVTNLHGENASYFHYIDPHTGEMMSLDVLAKETAEETRKRVDRGRVLANERRKARRDVLLFGSVQ